MNRLKGYHWIVALMLLFGAIGGSLHAQDVYPQSLVIELNNQNPKEVYTLQSLQKITFDQGEMQVQFKDGTPRTQAKLAEIKKLYFSTKEKPTAVELIELPAELSLSWYEDNNMLYIVGLPEGNYPIAVYQIDGTCIFGAEHFDASRAIDMSSWSEGYYIVKINNTTLKIVK